MNRKALWVMAILFVVSTMVLTACGGGGGSDGGGAGPAAKTSVKLARTGQVISYDTNTTQRDDGFLTMGVVWPSPRFTVASSGTGTVVSDNLTGLMWLQNANCINSTTYNPDGTGNGTVTWQHALDFVKGINNGTYSSCRAGYTDWRLPNRKELRSLIDHSQYSPALPTGHPFSNVQASTYWSSTTYAGPTNVALIIYMVDGSVLNAGKSATVYVWPVRSGQ